MGQLYIMVDEMGLDEMGLDEMAINLYNEYVYHNTHLYKIYSNHKPLFIMWYYNVRLLCFINRTSSYNEHIYLCSKY